MAEEKKDKDSVASNRFGEIVLLLFVLYFVSFTIERIKYWWQVGRLESSTANSLYAKIITFTSGFAWPLWKGFAAILVVLAFAAIWYAYMRMSSITKEESEKFGSNIKVDLNGYKEKPKNPKWEKIIENINSANSSDWKMAIIEADIMLEELLRRSGYHGVSIGEMLKSVEKSDMTHLDEAWEAHKIRNSIAHRGSDYTLTEREAKHAIACFEEVFKEFHMV